MIPVGKLIAHFQRMNAEHWPYEWGASRTGCVDCSGAFAGAYKRAGRGVAPRSRKGGASTMALTGSRGRSS